MGFFFSSNRVSEKDFKKAKWKLHEHGFSRVEIDEIENVFRGDLHEHGQSKGISKEELASGIHWLKDHPHNHHLSPDRIGKLEEILSHYL